MLRLYNGKQKESSSFSSKCTLATKKEGSCAMQEPSAGNWETLQTQPPSPCRPSGQTDGATFFLMTIPIHEISQLGC
jgi:hypothetical protein